MSNKKSNKRAKRSNKKSYNKKVNNRKIDKRDTDNEELLANLLIAWNMNEIYKNKLNIPHKLNFIDHNVKDPICNIINNYTKKFNIKIPIELGYIISICSNFNPDIGIMIYYNLLENIVKRNGKLPRDGYIITSEDFTLTFPDEFPNVAKSNQNEIFNKLWNEQKCDNGDNEVYSYSYWDKLFE